MKLEFSYLKPENSCFILGSALPRLQLCYGRSTYLPLLRTCVIRFYRLAEALRVTAKFSNAGPEEIIQRQDVARRIFRSEDHSRIGDILERLSVGPNWLEPASQAWLRTGTLIEGHLSKVNNES
jgi:hypothetical protein